MFSDGIAEKIHDGQDLLTHLEGSGKLSESNFSDLKDLLNDVYRKDLIKRIEEFSLDEGITFSTMYGHHYSHHTFKIIVIDFIVHSIFFTSL